MISKTFRIAQMIVLASFALSSAGWATDSATDGATCSNASLSGTYGFLHDGTDSNGAPTSAAVTQLAFDSTTGTFTGENTASHDGVIATAPVTGPTRSPRTAPALATPREPAPSRLWLPQQGSWPFTLFRRDSP